MNIDLQCGDIVYVVAFYTKELKSAAVKARVTSITTTERLETKGGIDKKIYELQVIDGCGIFSNGSTHCYAADSGYLFTNKEDAEKAVKKHFEKAVLSGFFSRLNVIMTDIETYRQGIDNCTTDMKKELDTMREFIKILAQEA